jgi:hypothetical protein
VTSVSADRQQRLLAVGPGPRSHPPFQVVEAASGLCRLLWLIDESLPGNAVTTRLLRRFGTVVDVAGMSPEEIASLLRAHRPDGVLAFRDEDIVLLALVAADLGLDYHPPEVGRRLVDKLLRREALRDAELPSPLFWKVPAERDPAADAAFAATVTNPAVLKPRRASGSRYAMPVADAGDLVGSLALLPPEAGGETGMPVGQHLPGLLTGPTDRFADFLSVESLVVAGEIRHVALNGRFPLAEPFRETGTFIPAEPAPAQQTAVREVGPAALGAIGVRTGTFHTEIKLTANAPRVIEVNGRIGGAVPEVLFRASGVSLFELAVHVALGEPVLVDGLIPCAKVGWRLMFQLPTSARRVVSVEGLDRLAGLAGVSSVFLNRLPGDAVDWEPATTSARSPGSPRATIFSRSIVSSTSKCRSSANEHRHGGGVGGRACPTGGGQAGESDRKGVLSRGRATAGPQAARLTAGVPSFRPPARPLLRSSDLTVTFVTDRISIPSTRVGGAAR